MAKGREGKRAGCSSDDECPPISRHLKFITEYNKVVPKVSFQYSAMCSQSNSPSPGQAATRILNDGLRGPPPPILPRGAEVGWTLDWDRHRKLTPNLNPNA